MTEKTINIPSFMTRPGMGSKPTQDAAPKAPSKALPKTIKPRAPRSKRAALRQPDQPVSDITVISLVGASQTARWKLEQLHQRDHHMLLWSTRGQGRVLLHGRRRGFSACNVIFVPAGHLFSIELGPQVQGLATMLPNDGRISLPDQAHLIRLNDSAEQVEFTGILDAMRRECADLRPLMNDALNAHAQLLSVTLRRAIDREGPPPRARATERLVRQFCDLLAQEFTSGNPMAWYAEQLDITPTHLTRVCRQSAGITAAEMLSQMVQHRARSLLMESDLPINRISGALGFGSAAYFTRFCQQHFGAAPTKLRKQARGI
ncbi:AraC family transcriptional regulator [Shimia sp. R9_3]|uniref:helix-turn-helix domain-containing protein n=1 Tax=Shimia sp. R9_3 TaxID=2821113 RepID=UPI001ADB6126|nr:helix-turn-helix domain-containing protein [Shimia sp. R9_3]